MGQPLILRLDDLRAAVTRALAAVEGAIGSEVVLSEDYYWHIPVDEAFELSREPTTLTVGQLSDDLAAMSDTEVRPESAWHDLAHLVGLLRALEHRVQP